MNREILVKILDLARWAPSGDNTQPWRFEIVGDTHLRIHGFDLRHDCLYDFGGYTSWMAHGALLETLRIAATRFGLAADWVLRPDSPETAPVYDVFLRAVPELAPDALASCIEKRVVQRRPLRTTPLSPAEHEQLTKSVGSRVAVQYFESWSERLAVARLLAACGQIRLTCPEAFPVHQAIIEWGARYSTDRLPEQSLGADPLFAKMMKWALTSWKRADFLNRYMLGTLLPRLEFDLIPGIACAGHVLMRSPRPPSGVDDYAHIGVAMQRLWLTACALGLYVQPELTPVVFRWYCRAGQPMSALPEIDRRVLAVTERFETLSGARADDSLVFLCRVGHGQPPRSRAIRKSVDELMVTSADGTLLR